MNFNLRAPCASCPFRSDKRFPLKRERVTEILKALLKEDKTFGCHKTTTLKGRGGRHKKAEHCAGALILLEKMGRPNMMPRLAERLGMYNPSRLAMKAPVYDTPEEMIEAVSED